MQENAQRIKEVHDVINVPALNAMTQAAANKYVDTRKQSFGGSDFPRPKHGAPTGAGERDARWGWKRPYASFLPYLQVIIYVNQLLISQL